MRVTPRTNCYTRAVLITSKFLTRVQQRACDTSRIDAVRALPPPPVGPPLAFFRAAGLNRCKRGKADPRAFPMNDQRWGASSSRDSYFRHSRTGTSRRVNWIGSSSAGWMCRRVVVGSINMPTAYAINSIPTQLPPEYSSLERQGQSIYHPSRGRNTNARCAHVRDKYQRKNARRTCTPRPRRKLPSTTHFLKYLLVARWKTNRPCTRSAFADD